mgnify:CR=1 FL=1
MTVKDLIKKLKTLDQDSEIKVYAEYDHGGGWGYDDIYKIKKESDSDDAYVIYYA